MHSCWQIIDWSIVRLQAVKIVTRHNQRQTIANQAVILVMKLLRISYRRKLLKIPLGKWIQGNLTGFKESVIFSVVYVLFINCFKLLGFNWLIKLPWQLRCPQTEQKGQQSIIFFSWAYALSSRGSQLNSPLACLNFACSNFAKKNKRLLAVYIKL